MNILKETTTERLVVIPLGSTGIVKYQIQKRLNSGTAFETTAELLTTVGRAAHGIISVADLKIIADDALQRTA